MKIIFLSTIFFFMFSETLQLIRGNKKESPVVVTTTTTPEVPPPPQFAPPDLGEIWHDLFDVNRDAVCQKEINQKKIMAEIQAEDERKYSPSIESNSEFYWLKKWGFGPVAYLIDYLDSTFRDEIIAEFKSIYNTTMHFSPENTPEYSDGFAFASKIKLAPASAQDRLLRELKKFEEKVDRQSFDVSANSVQIFQAFKEFKWQVDPGQADFAGDFVLKYDINHDGRLAPNELILGSIYYNRRSLGSKKCNNCYSTIARKIGALFTYLDCGETGFINADQMMKGLPGLRRTQTTYNIFALESSDNIRTNAINDFVLKNENVKEAAVSKQEFVQGVLLAFWDRQTDSRIIFENDDRNLKALRWSVNNMHDTAAYTYVKDIEKRKIQIKEEKIYLEWERANFKANQLKQILFEKQSMNNINAI